MVMRSGWCLTDHDDHHKCRRGPWSNGQECECVCHTDSVEGEAMLAESEARAERRAERLAEAQAQFEAWQGDPVTVDAK